MVDDTEFRILTWNTRLFPKDNIDSLNDDSLTGIINLGLNTTVDADGVALAAIKGLSEVVKEKDARIEALEERLEALERALRAD